jgi:ribose/xylose/arabinose/galactoside ABC-type transport system permease subunit
LPLRPSIGWSFGSLIFFHNSPFVGIFLFFAIALRDQGFLDPNNLLNVLRQTAIIAIMSMAMTFVLAAGEIDLSIGSIAGLVSVVTGLVLNDHNLVMAVAAGLATGLIVGLLNGFITAWIGVPSFLVTLGMMGIARGAGMWMSKTSAVPGSMRVFPTSKKTRPAGGLICGVILMLAMELRRSAKP